MAGILPAKQNRQVPNPVSLRDVLSLIVDEKDLHHYASGTECRNCSERRESRTESDCGFKDGFTLSRRRLIDAFQSTILEKIETDIAI